MNNVSWFADVDSSLDPDESPMSIFELSCRMALSHYFRNHEQGGVPKPEPAELDSTRGKVQNKIYDFFGDLVHNLR
jgi:hypothetical protein